MTGGDDREGLVLVATHPDSRHLDDVLARGHARTLESDSGLAFFTVMTRPPIDHVLSRLRTRLDGCPRPGHLVASRVDTDGLPAAERSRLVAAEIVAAAQQLRAAAVVVGDDPPHEPTPAGVVQWLVTTLPPSIELCFGVPGTTELRDLTRPPRTDDRVTNLDGVQLTDEGRRLLAVRRHNLERSGIVRARQQLHRQPKSARWLLDYEREVDELRRLTHLIAHAPATLDIADDPERVELGERVELMLETGTHRKFVVVDAVEAERGRACVAATSGLGRALLGRRIGEWVTIPTRRGPRQARIVAAAR